MSRNFAVKNTFPVAVAVHNVSLGPPQGGDEVGSQRNGGEEDSGGGGFRIESFVPTVIGPGQTKDTLFILTLPLSSGMLFSCSTLKSMVNAKSSKEKFRPCNENGCNWTVPTISNKLCVL